MCGMGKRGKCNMKKLGFGCMRLPMMGGADGEVDKREFCRMVDTFLAEGFCYFDTAHGYLNGKSETALRECLTARYPRESYILTDKLTSFFFEKEDDILPLFEQQLEKTGVSYFDYYLLHALNGAYYEKFTRCKMLALLSTFCGCTFITGIFSSKMTLTLEAFGFGLASGIGYALYSIFSKLALRRYNTLTITAYTFYFAAIAALPMAEPLQLFTLLADLRALIGAIAIALICTVAPYLLYTRGLQDVDAGQASILATLEPLVAAAIGIFIFGESLTTAKILGMILILSSIFILNTAKNNVK